jgi:hypothetical protein
MNITLNIIILMIFFPDKRFSFHIKKKYINLSKVMALVVEKIGMFIVFYLFLQDNCPQLLQHFILSAVPLMLATLLLNVWRYFRGLDVSTF